MFNYSIFLIYNCFTFIGLLFPRSREQKTSSVNKKAEIYPSCPLGKPGDPQACYLLFSVFLPSIFDVLIEDTQYFDRHPKMELL